MTIRYEPGRAYFGTMGRMNVKRLRWTRNEVMEQLQLLPTAILPPFRPSLATVPYLLVFIVGALCSIGTLSKGDVFEPTPSRVYLNPDSTGLGFGVALAALGEDLLIGDPFTTDGGAVYRFTRDGELVQTYHNPLPGGRDDFGWSIATSDNRILVGAPLEGPSSSGRAYLLDAATGATLKTFTYPEPPRPVAFGFSVEFLGDDAIIGSRDYAGPIDGFRPAVYRFSTSTGSLTQTFEYPDGGNRPYFGEQILARGDDLFIAAPIKSESGGGGHWQWVAPGAGLVTVDLEHPNADVGVIYQMDSVTGQVIRRFEAIGLPGNRLGNNLALLNGNLLAGDPFSSTEVYGGAAHLFDVESGEVLQSFIDPDPIARGWFGFAVGAINNLAAVSNWGHQHAGAVHLFDSDSGALLQTLRDPSAEESHFGYTMETIGTDLLVAAPSFNGTPQPSGVYRYRLIPEPATMLLALIGVAALAATRRMTTTRVGARTRAPVSERGLAD